MIGGFCRKSVGRGHRVTWWLGSGVFLMILVVPAWGQSLRGNENEIKAAFLVNFTKMVEWPSTAFATKGEPLVICVEGNEDIMKRLFQALNGKSVADHSVSVTRTHDIKDARRCRVLFAGSETKDIRSILEAVGDAPVLTIGESNGFAQAGGVVNLYQQGDGVRFEINLDAAERAGLKINSRVLGLARIIREPRRGDR